MGVLDPKACELLRHCADGNERYVLSGTGISTARALVRFGLLVETRRLRGKRVSAYYRITALGRGVLGVQS
jgi:hypothetical protein